MACVLVTIVSISGLLFLLQIVTRRVADLRQRVAALEGWRWNVEEGPKRQVMHELDLAIVNLRTGRQEADQEPGANGDDRTEAAELRERVSFLAQVAVKAGVNPAEVLARLQKDRVEPAADLLRFIELFRR